MVDYNLENTKIEGYNPGEANKFWRPKAGQYKVMALTELGDSKPFEEEGKEPKPQMEISIKVYAHEETENGKTIKVPDKEYIWTMSKGKTKKSTYGQLIKLGVTKGRLANVEFMVVVTSDGKNNSYTIVTL